MQDDRAHASNLRTLVMTSAAALAMIGCRAGTSLHAPDEDSVIEPSGEVITVWSEHIESSLFVDSKNIDPLPATRTLSMVHVAMHDAVNAARPVYAPYAYLGQDPAADPVVAAASAAHRVLVRRFPAQASDLDSKLAASIERIPDGIARARGLTLGAAVGDHVIEMRSNDHSTEVVQYVPRSGPGSYQYVPPYDGFINRPGWRAVTPWTLRAAEQFRAPPPPPLDSTAYAIAYNEVRRSGALESGDRTEDETRYAKFWYENSDTGWNRITRITARDKRLGIHDSARLFALVNIAMADGFVAGWDAKFHYDLWRPYTAIRAGESDGNDGTAPDPKWSPLLATPPVQDYPSTHSILGAAAATVLARVVGDNTTFTTTSSTAEGEHAEPRTFASFSQAARENGDSRVRAGLHFRFAVDAGLEMGKQIGNQAVDLYLRHRAPDVSLATNRGGSSGVGVRAVTRARECSAGPPDETSAPDSPTLRQRQRPVALGRSAGCSDAAP